MNLEDSPHHYSAPSSDDEGNEPNYGKLDYNNAANDEHPIQMQDVQLEQNYDNDGAGQDGVEVIQSVPFDQHLPEEDQQVSALESYAASAPQEDGRNFSMDANALIQEADGQLEEMSKYGIMVKGAETDDEEGERMIEPQSIPTTAGQVLVQLKDVVLPDGEQVIKTLSYMNMALQAEIMLSNFHSIMFYQSVTEVFLGGLIFIFFLRAPTQMWYFLFHAPHLFRALFGFSIIEKIPRSHNIVDLFKPKDPNAVHNDGEVNEQEEATHQLSFENFDNIFRLKVSAAVLAVVNTVKTRLKMYALLTFVCFVCDVADLTIQRFEFVVKSDQSVQYASFLLMSACFVYIVLDLYYLAWAYHAHLKLPEDMQKYSMQAFLGFTGKASKELAKKVATIKTSGKSKLGALAGLRKFKKSESGNGPVSLGRQTELQVQKQGTSAEKQGSSVELDK